MSRYRQCLLKETCTYITHSFAKRYLLNDTLPQQRYLLNSVYQSKVCSLNKSNLIAVWQTLRNQGFTDEGQFWTDNSRSAPLPSLALGPWEIVFIWRVRPNKVTIFCSKFPNLGAFLGRFCWGAVVAQREFWTKNSDLIWPALSNKHLFPKEPLWALGGAERCPRSLSEVGYC